MSGCLATTVGVKFANKPGLHILGEKLKFNLTIPLLMENKFSLRNLKLRHEKMFSI